MSYYDSDWHGPDSPNFPNPTERQMEAIRHVGRYHHNDEEYYSPSDIREASEIISRHNGCCLTHLSGG